MSKSNRSTSFLLVGCLGGGLALSFMASHPVAAQTVCGDRTSLLKQLAGNYKEAPVSMGLASNGSVVEVTKSDKGTWTILLTNPTGVTCLIAAGENWTNIAPKVIEEKT